MPFKSVGLMSALSLLSHVVTQGGKGKRSEELLSMLLNHAAKGGDPADVDAAESIVNDAIEAHRLGQSMGRTGDLPTQNRIDTDEQYRAAYRRAADDLEALWTKHEH